MWRTGEIFCRWPCWELIRKVCRANPAEKGKYIKIILALLQSTSTAVVYECAVTLVSLSNAPYSHHCCGQLLLPDAGQPERQQRQAHCAGPVAGAHSLLALLFLYACKLTRICQFF